MIADQKLSRHRLGAAMVVATVCLCGTAELRADDKPAPDITSVVTLLELVIDADEDSARRCLAILTRGVQSGELEPARVAALRDKLHAKLAAIAQDNSHPLRFDAGILATSWGDADAAAHVREVFLTNSAAPVQRIAALQALIAGRNSGVLNDALATLTDPASGDPEFRGQVIAALGRLDDPQVAGGVLERYSTLDPQLQPRTIELLTQRPAWSKSLLTAIAGERISKDALNLNQLRRIAASDDPELQAQFHSIYGALREGRDPQREQLVNEMRNYLREHPGDPHQGALAFKKVCAQCHKIHGEGAEVGPDITRNGRNDWEQLLSNVFDPSLVIGPGYQARQLLTTDGRVLTGLPVEESADRVILKVQGGKTETIPRDQIEEYKTSDLSLMPEQLEKQLTQQEITDLMSYLALDKPPTDPEARYLPGAPVKQ